MLLVQNLQLQSGCCEHSAGRHQRGALTDSLLSLPIDSSIRGREMANGEKTDVLPRGRGHSRGGGDVWWHRARAGWKGNKPFLCTCRDTGKKSNKRWVQSLSNVHTHVWGCTDLHLGLRISTPGDTCIPAGIRAYPGVSQDAPTPMSLSHTACHTASPLISCLAVAVPVAMAMSRLWRDEVHSPKQWRGAESGCGGHNCP